jgi:hypothetical protein
MAHQIRLYVLLQLCFRGRLHLRFECAVWMCVSLSNVFLMSFLMSKNQKITLKTHSTRKRISKLHIQNASVIDPLRVLNLFFRPSRMQSPSPFPTGNLKTASSTASSLSQSQFMDSGKKSKSQTLKILLLVGSGSNRAYFKDEITE